MQTDIFPPCDFEKIEIEGFDEKPNKNSVIQK
jgi:hypothetical protein